MITRRDFGKQAAIATVGAAALPLIGCGGQSSVTTTLQLVIAGAEAILPFIPGVAPAQAVLINGWLVAVGDATTFATQELASADSALLKATKIGAEFAKVIEPNLPPG